MQSHYKVGLCGRSVCHHICSRVQYCPLGLELSYRRLRAQRVRRELRRAAVDQLESNIRKAAGSFEEFSRKLVLESQRRKSEQLETISSL